MYETLTENANTNEKHGDKAKQGGYKSEIRGYFSLQIISNLHIYNQIQNYANRIMLIE